MSRLDSVFELLNGLYLDVLKRPIDPSGYMTYSQLLQRDEVSVEFIAEQLRASEEFAEINHATRQPGTTKHSSTLVSTGFPDSDSGKLRINSVYRNPEHRSGWSFAMQGLASLHHRNGVLLDDFIEERFARKFFSAANTGEIPYLEPWVGILHNPPNMPAWFDYDTSPQIILSRRHTQQSLGNCRGLFVLSRYLGDWLREQVDVPVCNLNHPMDKPLKQFDLDAFMSNPAKKVLQIGYWMRRLHSLRFLDVPTYEKVWVITQPNVRAVADREAATMDVYLPDGQLYRGRYRECSWVPHDEYDDLLSANLVFMDIYDISASNTIVECIARNTPIAIRALPGAVEYLGKDYPLYFDTLEEAAKNLEDLDTVKRAYFYLRDMDKSEYTRESFCRQLYESKIYQGLPMPDRSTTGPND